MKLQKLKIRRRKRNRAQIKQISKTVKCLVMGSTSKFIDELNQSSNENISQNEAEIEVGSQRYLFWTLPNQSALKKSFLKQYLSYHKCEIVFFIVNQDEIEVYQYFMHVSFMMVVYIIIFRKRFLRFLPYYHLTS